MSETNHAFSNGEATPERLEKVETNGGRPACFKSTVQEVLFVLTATMAIAMPAFLTGAVTVISSFIGEDLDMTTAEITWITSAASLSSGAFLLFFGRVADLFGRKALFVGSLFFFSVFAVAAGFARTPIALDVLSGVMGLMSASAVPPALGMLGVIYDAPSKRKNAAFACFSGGNPLGFVFGTIFSGIATQLFNWRASFYLIAIIFCAFSVVGVVTVPKDTAAKEPFSWATLKRFDALGTLLAIAGIGMFSAALSLGSTAPQGWRTAYVLALLVVGVGLMAGFVVWESLCRYPLVPLATFKDRNFSLCLAVLMLGYVAFGPASFFVALYFQDVLRLSALEVAVHVLPMAIMGILVNIFAGAALHRISNRALMLVGAASYAVAFLLFAVNRAGDSYWAFFFPGLTIMVVGADLEFNVTNMYVMSSMPATQQSAAAGIFQTVVRVSMTVGFGVTTALFNAVEMRPSLADYWDDASQPYAATFWFCTACSALSVCMVPFLTLKTQGGREKKAGEDGTGGGVSLEERGIEVVKVPDVK